MRTGVVLSAVVSAVLMSSCTSGGPSEPAPAPPGLERGCPEPSAALHFPEGELPPGATSVRLCPGEPQGTTGRLGAPADLLVTGVRSVVDAVNDLDEAPAGQACTMEGGFDLVYWFGYPDGDWRAVRLGAYGCRFVEVGPDERRVGGMPVAAAFAEALSSQRAASSPPDAQHEATCEWPGSDEQTWSPLPGSPVQLRTAVLCRVPRAHHYRAAPVPADMIADLDAGLLTSGPVPRCRGERELLTVEGWTTWGDRQTYFLESCGRVTTSRGPAMTVAGETQASYAIDPVLLDDLLSLPQGPLVDVRDQR